QTALVMRLLAKPSFVFEPKPAHCHRIRDQRARRQLVIPPGEPPADQTGDRPESDQRDDYQQEIAIAPAKPPIGTDSAALFAAVRSIINLRATGRTLHSDANCWQSSHRRIGSKIRLKANAFVQARLRLDASVVIDRRNFCLKSNET